MVLGKSLFEEINAHLELRGLKLREGTIVDASIIEAPSSTKNRAGERDPEMHQTKKGNQSHFGMKLHIGVDSVTGLAAQREPRRRPTRMMWGPRPTICCTVGRRWCGATPGIRECTSGRKTWGVRWTGRWR